MTGVRLLALLGVVFVAGFALQHARSPVVRIAGEVEIAERVATGSGLGADEVMALRELLGADLAEAVVLERARELVALRARLGSDDLAVVALAGHRALVERLLAEADADVERARAALRPLPEAIAAARFAELTRRFAWLRAR